MSDRSGQHLGTRARHRQRVTAQFVSHARAMTRDRGLAGFSVQDLADATGVSARTFFNYFRCKEDAVLGYALESDPEEFAGAFIALGPSGCTGALRDLAALSDAAWAGSGSDRGEVEALVSSEPRLRERAYALAGGHHEGLCRLVAARESVRADDPGVTAAVALFSAASLLALTTSAGGSASLSSIVAQVRDVAGGDAPDPARP